MLKTLEFPLVVSKYFRMAATVMCNSSDKGKVTATIHAQGTSSIFNYPKILHKNCTCM
jgi:hypothetical protein